MSKNKYGYDHTAGEGQKRLMYESIGIAYERKIIDVNKPGDYGCDPLGNGMFKMIPSGDVVDYEERNKRLNRRENV